MNIYRPTYLYVKQHSKTGLKYFGKTIHDPIKYLGSGKYWNAHISKHGKEHVVTLWHKLFNDKEDLIRFATKFSVENHIVESTEWANLAPENGLDGGQRPTETNYLIKVWNNQPRSEKVRLAMKQAKVNNHSGGVPKKPVTIDGVTYPSQAAACRTLQISYDTLYRRLKPR